MLWFNDIDDMQDYRNMRIHSSLICTLAGQGNFCASYRTRLELSKDTLALCGPLLFSAIHYHFAT